MKLARMEILSETEINQIHEASCDILASCGVRVFSRRLLDALAGKGLDIAADTGIVRFPRTRLEDALTRTPTRFEMFDREGCPAFVLGDGESRIAAGHNAVFWADTENGARRPSTVADVETFARVCDQLERIDVIGIPVMPQDVPNPKATLLWAIRAVAENSRKPIFFSTESPAVNRSAMALLAAAFAGDTRSQPYGIGQLSPTSPLFWEEGAGDALVDTVRAGIPLAILPEPNAGVSAPYSLAGLLTVNNAECLSGIAMAQLIAPGAKVMYANSWTATDMRSGAALVGSTETSLCRIAGTQLARHYRVPSHTTAPNSDNHAHDEQNAWEKTLSTFTAVAAGTDLIVNCGMFATGMTCSHEQLIMDEEISAMSLRIAAGIDVSQDAIAADLIKQVGPQGNYLTTDHTLQRLRGGEFLPPRVSVRGPYALWEAAGAKNTYALARERAEALGGGAPNPIDAIRLARLAEIVAAFQ